jgi:putative proteasome-type protease
LTYCLGIKVRDGLIGLADGRITSGTQLTSARKVTLHGPNGSQFFIMTSGLRSLRDKAIAYLERDRRAAAVPYATMLDAVDAYTQCLRHVIDEDRKALEHSHIAFNLHAIIGGQLAQDEEPTMFLVYPECNWIQVDERTPYLSISVTGYGKPILDRRCTTTRPCAQPSSSPISPSTRPGWPPRTSASRSTSSPIM